MNMALASSFDFEVNEASPMGEYRLIADPRFLVEVQGAALFQVVETSLPQDRFFVLKHHGTHRDLDKALVEAVSRATPVGGLRTP